MAEGVDCDGVATDSDEIESGGFQLCVFLSCGFNLGPKYNSGNILIGLFSFNMPI